MGEREIQNLRCMSRNVSLNPNDINYDKQVNGQIKLNETELACVANWSWKIDFTRKTTQSVVKNFKNYENAATEKKDWLNTDWRSIPCSRNGIQTQWVNFWLKSENYRIR